MSKNKSGKKIILLKLFLTIFAAALALFAFGIAATEASGDCGGEYVIPVKDSTSVTIWEQTDAVKQHTYSTSKLLSSGGIFSTTAGECYRVSVVDGGKYLKISCSRSRILGGIASGNNIVAVRLNGINGTNLYANKIIDYQMGLNGIEEAVENALGDPWQTGPYGGRLCTFMGDLQSSLTLGFTGEKECECEDECDLGDKECDGPDGYAVCVMDGKCTKWKAYDCPNGQLCKEGKCVETCEDACDLGDKKCSGASNYQICGYQSGEKCTSWITKSCGSGKICEDGECVESCVDECSLGNRRCADSGGYQVCEYPKYVYNGTGLDKCTKWSAIVDCGSDQKCVSGKCVDDCTDHYEKKCYGDDLYWYDSCGGKQEPAEDCGTSQWTDNYRCSGDWIQREKITRGCLYNKCFSKSEWEDKENCSDLDKTCSGGYCKTTCTDQCSYAGEKRCSSSTYWQECRRAGDGCLKWSESVYCESGKVCEHNGECVKECGQPQADAGPDKEIYEYETVTLEGSGDDPYCDDLSYSWSCNGGSLSDPDSKRPVFKGPGVNKSTLFVCTLTVENDCGKKDSDTVNIVVKTKSAGDFTVSLGADPDSGCAPLDNVDLRAEVTVIGDDDYNDEFTYYFSCENDGHWDKTVTTTNTSVIIRDLCDYEYEDVYTANVRVESHDSSRSASDTVTIDARDCEAREFAVSLEADPDSGCAPLNNVDLTAKLQLDDSYDDDDEEYTYYFDCRNRGTWDKIVTTDKENVVVRDLCDYSSPGDYTAKVRVESHDRDRSATDTVKIEVDDCDGDEFTVRLEAEPDSGCKPLRDVDITARVSCDDDDYDGKFTYYFDCRNRGTWDKIVTVSDTSYTAKNLCDYESSGDYTAKVKVVSHDGDYSATDTATVEVDDCKKDGKGKIEVEKLASNLSIGGGYSETISAAPGDVIAFKVKIRANDGDLTDAILRDGLPDRFTEPRDIRINGKNYAADIVDGLEIGDIDEGETVTVTYTANIASSKYFSYGQTKLTNSVEIETKTCSETAEATVTVAKKQVEGATTVSTGFTNNPFIDSFVLPLAAALLFVWLLKARILKIEEWLDARRKQYLQYRSQKMFGLAVAKLKAKGIVDRLR